MVLQKTANVPIWGKADPGEDVSVSLAGAKATTKAGDDGKWKLVLNLKDSAPGPFEMTVQGKNLLKIFDVAVGEVWVASGQSNMAFTLKNTIDADKEISDSANPMLRQFTVKKSASPTPLDDTEGQWIAASPETSGNFTAVGYFFARIIQNELQVPVGIVHTSWGGTPSEAWTSPEALKTVPELADASNRLWADFAAAPAIKTSYLEKMAAWISENAREDKPSDDVPAFAGLEVPSEGWTKVRIPGPVEAPGLPNSGVIWLRTEIDISSPTALSLSLPINGFDTVYWNGEKLAQTTYATFPGLGSARQGGPFSLGQEKVKPGKNVLAIRLYAPTGPASFFAEPKAAPLSLGGDWMAKAEFSFPELSSKQLAAAPEPPKAPPAPKNTASFLFNGMINPIVPYAIRGVIWYQGEANAGRALQYHTAFPLLISDWRKVWAQGDSPFYFCQLANFMPKKPQPVESAWAELREAQNQTQQLPHTGQAVLIDIGESGDIHPRNKKDAGERLARLALANDYGKSVPDSGPVLKSVKVEGDKIRLSFDKTDGGLAAAPLAPTYTVKSKTGESSPLVRNSPNSQLEGFAICGEGRKWVWADAKIDGDSVLVWSEKIPSPVAVRYAWSDNPTCNLTNAAGLPASPFRTDDFPLTTANARY